MKYLYLLGLIELSGHMIIVLFLFIPPLLKINGILFINLSCAESSLLMPHLSDSPKIHFLWRIRHAPVDLCEESEQHSY